MPVVQRAMLMSRDYNPKALIIEKLEKKLEIDTTNLPELIEDHLQPLAAKAGLRVFGPDYLLAVYDRAGQKTRSGLVIPQDYGEDRYQGKVALVVGIGPMCKGDEYYEWFGGYPPNIGDWVVTTVKDGVNFLVGDQMMKLVEYKYLRMATFEPDIIM